MAKHGSPAGVEVVARDRSTEYARAITEGAPDALQVADRWHLLHNLRQVLVRHLTSVRGRLKALPGAENLPANGPPARRRSRAEQAASSAARNRHLARYTEVRRLHAEDGLNILQIARTLTTVRKYLAADAFPERGRHAVPPSILAPYQGYLNARWVEGARSALGEARSDSGARSKRSATTGGPRGPSRSGRRLGGRSLTRARQARARQGST